MTTGSALNANNHSNRMMIRIFKIAADTHDANAKYFMLSVGLKCSTKV